MLKNTTNNRNIIDLQVVHESGNPNAGSSREQKPEHDYAQSLYVITSNPHLNPDPTMDPPQFCTRDQISPLGLYSEGVG